MGEGRSVYRVFVERSEVKRSLERPRRRWDHNICIDLREIGIDGANWIRLARDMVRWGDFVSTVMNLRGSIKKAGYFLTRSVKISSSNNILHHGESKKL
jgi:hypothetical protein